MLLPEGSIIRQLQDTCRNNETHVVWREQSAGLVAIKCEGQLLGASCNMFRLIKEATQEEYDTFMATHHQGRPRVGNIIRLNDNFDSVNLGYDPAIIGPGVLGEIASLDNDNTICKMDGKEDSVIIFPNNYEIIDDDYEQRHKFKAVAMGKKAHPDDDHTWTYKWDETYRECTVCGATSWRLACWTGNAWHYKTPRAILVQRPDLKRPKGFLKPVKPVVIPPPPHFRTRSQDLIRDEHLRMPIHIIGAGAIGSFTALALVKMGFTRINVMDNDVVSIENVGTQLYGEEVLASPKTEGLLEILGCLGPSDAQISVEQVRYRNRVFENGIVILAVDNMLTRRQAWEAHAAVGERLGSRVATWIIDPRMGAEQAQIYTMSPKSYVDRDVHPKSLYSDEDALQEPCTAAGTTYTAMLVAGQIAKNVKDIVTGVDYARTIFWNIKANTQRVFMQDRREKRNEFQARPQEIPPALIPGALLPEVPVITEEVLRVNLSGIIDNTGF